MRFARKNKGRKIVVGMSGGVDSSLAAAILKKKGWDVIGVTFKMWPKEECGLDTGRACCSLEAVTRSRAVSEQLQIPYYVVDFSEEFKKEVIDYFCTEYLKGRTPNPCVICNEKIKFGLLMQKAQELGADLIATGHYVNAAYDRRRGRYVLREGRDARYEQSYFLFSLSQEQIRRSIFPLGRYTKAAVRAYSKKLGLETFDAVSSQDICFIHDMEYAEYIRKKTGVKIERGDIVDVNGKVLGTHKGIPYYTIGQRRGLGIANVEPLYVTGIDIAKNRIIVGAKKDVLKKSFIADRLNWVAVKGMKKTMRVSAKIRYNHKKAKALVTKISESEVRVDLDNPQESPTPGQAVVFYDKDVLVGGGWIRKIER